MPKIDTVTKTGYKEIEVPKEVEETQTIKVPTYVESTKQVEVSMRLPCRSHPLWRASAKTFFLIEEIVAGEHMPESPRL